MKRLVCHACGTKFPIGAAVPKNPGCCPKPELHVHDMAKPCELCEESGSPSAR